MIAAVAAIALAQGGHYAKWFPIPSGQNGYEEFLQAADIVHRTGSESTVWHSSKLDLRKSRDLVDKYGRALDLAERGLRKPLRPPWDPIDPDSDYVWSCIELVTVSELMENRIRVLLADGKPGTAADKIMVALDYSDRASEHDLMEAAAGGLERQFVFECLEQAAHKLSLGGAAKLSERFLSFSKKTPKVITGWKAQLPGTIRYIDKFLNHEIDPEDLEAASQFAHLTADQKSYYKDRIAAALVDYQSQLDAMFAKEESHWHDMRYTDADPLVEHAVYMLYPFPSAEAAVADRTRLRLAAHYCSVIEFKRTHNRLPASLAELGSAEQFHDPASGGQFVYRKDSDQSFTIYSNGNEWTGPIHLRSEAMEWSP